MKNVATIYKKCINNLACVSLISQWDKLIKLALLTYFTGVST